MQQQEQSYRAKTPVKANKKYQNESLFSSQILNSQRLFHNSLEKSSILENQRQKNFIKQQNVSRSILPYEIYHKNQLPINKKLHHDGSNAAENVKINMSPPKQSVRSEFVTSGVAHEKERIRKLLFNHKNDQNYEFKRNLSNPNTKPWKLQDKVKSCVTEYNQQSKSHRRFISIQTDRPQTQQKAAQSRSTQLTEQLTSLEQTDEQPQMFKDIRQEFHRILLVKKEYTDGNQEKKDLLTYSELQKREILKENLEIKAYQQNIFAMSQKINHLNQESYKLSEAFKIRSHEVETVQQDNKKLQSNIKLTEENISDTIQKINIELERIKALKEEKDKLKRQIVNDQKIKDKYRQECLNKVKLMKAIEGKYLDITNIQTRFLEEVDRKSMKLGNQ